MMFCSFKKKIFLPKIILFFLQNQNKDISVETFF